MSVAEVITDAAGRARSAATNMFVGAVEKAKAAVTAAQAKIDQNEADHAAELAAREAFLDRVAETGRTADTDATLRALDDHVAFFREMVPRLQVKLAAAERVLADAEDADAAKKRREFAKSQLRSFDQHIAEIKRSLAPLPELLAGIHKAVAEAQDANERAAELTGAEPVDIRALLSHAVAVAALGDWL